MANKITTFAIVLSLLLPVSSNAQSSSEGQFQPREALATIFYTGAFGAVLGLSTLSFVDKPSAHLKNIMIGGAIGIIVGVGYVAWEASTSQTPITQEIYQSHLDKGRPMRLSGTTMFDLYDKATGPSHYPGEHSFGAEPLQFGMRFPIPSI